MKLRRLFRISRPRFWIYELGPYVIGIVAASAGSIEIWYALPVLIFFVFFTYSANIYIYGINDIYDYETDKQNPKKVSYESLVLPNERKGLALHIAITSLPFLVYAFFTTSLTTFCALLAFFFFAGFYSVGPIRAKARPFLDSIFSAGHYIATAGFSYLLCSELLSIPIDTTTFIVSLTAGMLWAIAMHAYSAVPDIQADRDANLSTIATTLERQKTIILCALLYALSGLLSYPFLGMISIVLATIYVVFMILSLRADEKNLFRLYTYFPTINTLSGMTIFFTILLRWI